MEALNNALKHAQAHSAKVVIRSLPERIELEVHDDGKGFDPKQVCGGGMGLNNMHTHAQQLGGILAIESSTEYGTLVRFSLEKKIG